MKFVKFSKKKIVSNYFFLSSVLQFRTEIDIPGFTSEIKITVFSTGKIEHFRVYKKMDNFFLNTIEIEDFHR